MRRTSRDVESLVRPRCGVGAPPWRSLQCKPVTHGVRIMADQFEGGCLCGAVRFTATGQPKGVYWCHCQSCRKHSGAPASVFVAYEHSKYIITRGDIAKFDSSPGRTTRGFCA